MTRVLYRRLSLPITYALYGSPVTPHVISWAAGFIALLGMAILFLPVAFPAIGAVLALQLALLLDHVDGELARARNRPSVGGTFADDFAMEVLAPLAMAFGSAGLALITLGGRAGLLLAAAFAFVRSLNLLAYFLSVLYGRRAPPNPAMAGTPARRGPWSELVSWYCVTSKVIGALSILLLADWALSTSHIHLVAYGYSVSLVTLYVGLGVPVLLISTLANAIHGTRGEFQSG